MKGIRMLWDTFDQNAYFELGNGSLLKFMTDKWLAVTLFRRISLICVELLKIPFLLLLLIEKDQLGHAI